MITSICHWIMLYSLGKAWKYEVFGAFALSKRGRYGGIAGRYLWYLRSDKKDCASILTRLQCNAAESRATERRPHIRGVERSGPDGAGRRARRHSLGRQCGGLFVQPDRGGG